MSQSARVGGDILLYDNLKVDGAGWHSACSTKSCHP